MQSRQRRHVWHLLLVYFPTFVLCPRGASGTAEYGAFPVLEACVIDWVLAWMPIHFPFLGDTHRKKYMELNE